jgi:hypothetical protein
MVEREEAARVSDEAFSVFDNGNEVYVLDLDMYGGVIGTPQYSSEYNAFSVEILLEDGCHIYRMDYDLEFRDTHEMLEADECWVLVSLSDGNEVYRHIDDVWGY